jgi:GLPGLI family protein
MAGKNGTDAGTTEKVKRDTATRQTLNYWVLSNLLVNLARRSLNIHVLEMKRLAYILPALVAVMLSLQLSAQKKLTEATIAYDIVINTNNTKPQAADLLDGATSVIYLKGNSSRSEMVSSLGTQATIIDGKTGDVSVLKDYGDQKYIIKMTPAEWKESNRKYEGVNFTYLEEYKTIAGYNCQKAIGKLSDGSTFTVYFTKELVPVNKDFQYLNKNLPGLAMQYEATLGKLMVTYTVASILFNPVPQAKFDLPKSGYRVMTYSESRNAAGNKR